MADITVNTDAIDELGANIEKAKGMLLGRLAERGYQLLRIEVPYQTGNLKQGVAPPDVNYPEMEAVLTVSARSGRTGISTGEVFDKDHKKVRNVSLRPSPAFNYAAAVARGRTSIAPRHGKALLIPVNAAPAGEGYLLAGGQIYVYRKSAAAVPANPFDERAAVRLEAEAPKIGEGVLREFV